MVVLPTGYSISAPNFWNSFRLTVGLFLTSQTKALLSQLANLAKMPTLPLFGPLWSWECSKPLNLFYTPALIDVLS